MAGKIEQNGWRHNLVPHLRSYDFSNIKSSELIFDKYLYTGPFFIGCDHGCSHGNSTHGCGVGGEVICNEYNPSGKEVYDSCIKQIDQCDYVFCWLDSLDAYGTYFELGIAREKGKKIFLAISDKIFPDTINKNGSAGQDLWFIRQGCGFESDQCGHHHVFVNVKQAWDFFEEWVDNPITEKDKNEFEEDIKRKFKTGENDYRDLLLVMPMSKVIRYFKRDQNIVFYLKKLYNSKCQVKDCGYTFKKQDGKNYCETHHLIPLGKNGDDDIKNMICVCPNHHRFLHYGKREEIKGMEFIYKKEHEDLINKEVTGDARTID